ncbi:hypothetical protein LRH25_18360 [Ideonella azotifigens]|uniref:Tetratricopeptide repeat protein n=1 Tax=Ideonella azotifigens TaxID=513160 RepID=A0ABP3VHF0_9BURK|nr:hypothetical protein [Ideonella azotifigens]MCD2342296.1 hypothetical protein [Ideonella azotifigens]
MEFMRFNSPDPDALAIGIEEARAKFAAARLAGDMLATVEHAADLGSMLTTARREGEALELMQTLLAEAEAQAAHEPAGWFFNAYATALQYCDRRDEANDVFAKALALCRNSRWSRLQSFVLQHWGRSLVERQRLDEAQACFMEALDLRVQLNDPRQASTRKALEALAELRGLRDDRD